MALANKFISRMVDVSKGDSLKAKCARGSFWLGLGGVAEKVLAFVSKIILARLLVPQELGLIVLIISITAFFDVLTEVGIKQSVIQNKNGASSEYLNMAWWFQSIRALCLYLAAFIASPWICKFYFSDKPEILSIYDGTTLTLMIRLAFLSIIFNGFMSSRAHVMEKEFRFDKSIIIMQGSAFTGLILTIILAFTIRNAWAMVLGFICQAGLRLLLSYIVCPFMPRLKFHRNSFDELLQFARGMFGSPFLAYLANNLDILVGGRFVSTEVMGLYGFAVIIARGPQELYNRIINPILLPAFAAKQTDKTALCRAVLKLTKIIALTGMPLVVLAFIYGDFILSTIYKNPDFTKVSTAFGFFCINVLLLIQVITLNNVLFGMGKPEKHRWFVIVRLLLLVLFIFPVVDSFGITGVACLLAVINLVSLAIQVLVVHNLIGLKAVDYLLAWSGGALGAFVMFVSNYVLQYIIK